MYSHHDRPRLVNNILCYVPLQYAGNGSIINQILVHVYQSHSFDPSTSCGAFLEITVRQKYNTDFKHLKN